jgi:hypothetical protein
MATCEGGGRENASYVRQCHPRDDATVFQDSVFRLTRPLDDAKVDRAAFSAVVCPIVI